MQHSIERIIEACNQVIARSEEKENLSYLDKLTAHASSSKKTVEKRKQAAAMFGNISDQLSNGGHLTDVQAQFVTDLHGYYRDRVNEIKLADLVDDLDQKPERNERPGPTHVYQLRSVMQNLKRDNDGRTTVSTSFLKDAGFGTTVISWIARI